jgi:hypothetical protein
MENLFSTSDLDIREFLVTKQFSELFAHLLHAVVYRS